MPIYKINNYMKPHIKILNTAIYSNQKELFQNINSNIFNFYIIYYK